MNMFFRVVMISGLVMASSSRAMEDFPYFLGDLGDESQLAENVDVPKNSPVSHAPVLQPAASGEDVIQAGVGAKPVSSVGDAGQTDVGAKPAASPAVPLRSNKAMFKDVKAFGTYCAQNVGVGLQAAFWASFNGACAFRKAVWTPSFTNKAHWRKHAYRTALVAAVMGAIGYVAQKKYGRMFVQKYEQLKRYVKRKMAQRKQAQLA